MQKVGVSHIFYCAGLVLFCLSWLFPDHYRPWLSFHSEALAFASIPLLVVGLLISHHKAVIPSWMGSIVFVAALPAIQCLTGISSFTGDASIAAFYLAGLLLAMAVGYGISPYGLGESTPSVLLLAQALCVAALASTVIGLLQWLNQSDLIGTFTVQADKGARALGNLAQPNHLATLLLMGIVAMTHLFERNVIDKLELSLGVCSSSFVLVLTQSRSGMVSVFMVSAFLLWKQSSSQLRIPRKVVFGWLIGFIVLTLLLPNINQFLMLGDVRSLTATGSVSERWLIWKQVVYAIGQAPWFGYGWNQTPTANAMGALAFPGSTTYTNAHNIVLDLMVWCGIPLGLLLTGLMVYWTVSRMRSVKKPDSVLAMAALLPIAVHSMLEYPFAYAYFLISAGFFVGIVEAAHVPAKTVAIKARWLWMVLCVWSGIGAYIAFEYFQIEEDFRIVRFENLRVGTTPAGYEVPHVWMLSHMAVMLNAARQVPKPDMPKADLENLRKVSDRFAYGAIRFKYAQALGLNGDPAGAAKQMQIIHGLYGDFYYQACKDELIRLSNEKFPQLKSVQIP